jgi:hypothetical protein
MLKKILILSLLALFICSFAYFSDGPNTPKKSDRVTVKNNKVTGYENVSKQNLQFINTPMVFEGTKAYGDYVIGPEIPITGLSGFYDYQFNGTQPHYLYRTNATEMHAIYMLTLDSTAPTGPTRRTKYAFSDDDGNTWQDLGEVPPNYRSGYPSLTVKSDGSAAISNHMLPVPPATGDLTTYMHYDLLPGGGTFTSVRSDPTLNFIWPLVARLTNGNILTVGSSYRGSAGTDTPVVSIFNTTTNTFGPDIERLTGSTTDNNASYACATAPGGKAIFVVNAYREAGGNWGASRIFESHSNDNGATWSPFSVIFNPHVIGTDSIIPNFNGATDVIYDNAGNYYMAFNGFAPSATYSSLRLLISKNGGEPIIITGGHTSTINPIPESVDSMVQQDFIASFDHPCLSISTDQQYIFVSFSVTHQNDTLNTYNKCHIYYSWASLSNLNSWQQPIRITNAGPNSFDERYASIETKTPVSNNQYTVYFSYQKDTQPGSYVTNTAPVSRAWRVFRKVSDATNPIGIMKNTEIVSEYRLDQNYPNPFNPVTNIGYNLIKNGFVTLKLYNILGEELRTLVNGPQPAGYQEVTFSASDLPSGVYFYTIEVKDQSGTGQSFRDTKKMVLVK